MSHALGRLVNHDPRSRSHVYPKARVAAAKSVNHPLRAVALHQGELGSCTGNTAAQWLNSSLALLNRKSGQLLNRARKVDFLGQRDAVDLYSAATFSDEISGTYPPTDTGASGLGVAKAMKRYGFISSYTWTFTFDGFLAALQRQPVMVGMNWYSGMNDPDDRGVIQITGPLEGGHEILARGVDFQRHRVRLRNSWGPEWGISGDCFLSFADMQRLLAEQGDVVVPGVFQPF